MSRQREKIRKAVEAKGYTLVSADWQPIGQQVEMAGREGGWTVMADPKEMAVGYSADDVLAWIDQFWLELPPRGKGAEQAGAEIG